MRIDNYHGTASTAGRLAPQAPTSGLHEGLSYLIGRLRQVNVGIDQILQRIHGLRPVANEPSAKNPETPSITQLCAYLDQQMGDLETYAADVAKFIG